MKTSTIAPPGPALALHAEVAADLMTPNPASVRSSATLQEAVRFLAERGFSGAPVVDHAGRAVGVLSRSDILRHDREELEHPVAEDEERPRTHDGEALQFGFHIERVDRTRVRDVMTPVVLSVTPETPAWLVAERLATLNVHRLFVIDRRGVLLGVISATDILRRLRREG